ncbi:hypothetical protein Cme02nite_29860 [Catellatospora methionotrophica]|uniref:Uncharacterized protein n=1 Tax=Catellatospora methionotrophica TaxID=121620 RepID=A0A8J3LAB2_9ACTN|nr:hypothetical protein [Catellatospora methionotrophica]GIG14654.1 hypothetical protein Cme02nite_29860 [Catellatospora methionotrophica]
MIRRLRHTRRGAFLGGLLSLTTAATALAGCATPPSGLTPSAGSSPPAVPSPSTVGQAPVLLPGGWQVIAMDDRVLDRARNVYVPGVLPRNAMLAANGLRYAVTGEDPQVVEIAGGKATRLNQAPALSLRLDPWSPDGDRLVVTTSRKEPFAMGFAVIDVASGKASVHWVDRSRYDCSQCSFVFTRDGKEIAMAVANRAGGEAAELVASVQLFDATTGVPTRSLPIKAMPDSPFAWSPDGSQVIARPDGLRQEYQVVDTRTGDAKPFPHAAVWATADALLAEAQGRVLTLRPDGYVAAEVALAAGLVGPVVFGPPVS